MTTDQPNTPIPQSTSDGEIVARAGRYYRNTRYIMFVVLLGVAGWFLYDGFVTWPETNKKIAQIEADLAAAEKKHDAPEQSRLATELKNYSRHTDTDIRWQRVIGFGLPPLAVLVLIYSLRKSRGAYRLVGTQLSVPGHPTIDLSDIKSVNNDLWDRKGIVWLQYELAGGQSGEIRLDDFIYERPPTDKIYDRIAEKFGLNEDDEDNEKDAKTDRESTDKA